MKIFILVFFLLCITVAYGQVTIKIVDGLADLSVEISDKALSPDIRISIGSNIKNPDFKVGITDSKHKADFILTKAGFADLTICADDRVLRPDITIEAGENTIQPDIAIKIEESGKVNYLVYLEEDDFTNLPLVVALLPAINIEMGYKFKNIPFFKGDMRLKETVGIGDEALVSLSGSAVYAQDDPGTFLGYIISPFNRESILNLNGIYGNLSKNSIWNSYSKFGNEFNTYSPFNRFSNTPPVIEKNGKVIGYLTTNPDFVKGISPYKLLRFKDRF